jgi:predicted ATPase
MQTGGAGIRAPVCLSSEEREKANGVGSPVKAPPGNIGIEHFIAPVGIIRLPAEGVPLQSEGLADEHGAPFLDVHGSQLAGLVDYYLRRNRIRFDEFVQAMRKLVPGLEGIDISTPNPALRRIDIVADNGFTVPPGQVSSGVRLMLFFVALAFHPTPPKLILVEEPENGLHPKRLADVIKTLRSLTAGKYGGHAAQVVLTTHSPYLLDLIDPATDQVLVFRREPDGSRSASPVDTERMKSFLDEFMLGEVWFNSGEEALVAKQK